MLTFTQLMNCLTYESLTIQVSNTENQISNVNERTTEKLCKLILVGLKTYGKMLYLLRLPHNRCIFKLEYVIIEFEFKLLQRKICTNFYLSR